HESPVLNQNSSLGWNEGKSPGEKREDTCQAPIHVRGTSRGTLAFGRAGRGQLLRGPGRKLSSRTVAAEAAWPCLPPTLSSSWPEATAFGGLLYGVGHQAKPEIHLCPCCLLSFCRQHVLSRHMVHDHSAKVSQGMYASNYPQPRSPGLEHQEQEQEELSHCSNQGDRAEGQESKENSQTLLRRRSQTSGASSSPHPTQAECAQGFIRKSYLISHQRTHSGEKLFLCSYYGRSFSLKSNLLRHLKTHSGEKPFVCNACGQGFIRKSSLIAHLCKHSEGSLLCAGEKLLSCSEFGQQFVQTSVVVKHWNTHSRQKCAKTSKARASLGHAALAFRSRAETTPTENTMSLQKNDVFTSDPVLQASQK
ncbi:hypothetical protein MC885_012218, partial [Smutsia gigantea]